MLSAHDIGVSDSCLHCWATGPVAVWCVYVHSGKPFAKLEMNDQKHLKAFKKNRA